ncbi:Hypothetical predicted protein [Mytilus galloprovincialis]|uniref:HECT domain-containing protein n=1 Tax=Mytilus galloprovincialis TaxID=29158 RepID=A0A8B6H1G9_MYTGA|nr:Hypothetical predicted protein [Mytilus galloprovincialis]
MMEKTSKRTRTRKMMEKPLRRTRMKKMMEKTSKRTRMKKMMENPWKRTRIKTKFCIGDHIKETNSKMDFPAIKKITYFTINPGSIKETKKTKKRKLRNQPSGGRRSDENLAKVLKFATSVEEEPILGFTLHPRLHFSERKSHLHTGNTCLNRLMLTVPENEGKVPEEDVLFNFFDYAFSNAYYGLQ